MLVCPTCRETAPVGAKTCPRDGTLLTGPVAAGSHAETLMGTPSAPPPPSVVSSDPVPPRAAANAPTRKGLSARLQAYLSTGPVEIKPGTMVGDYEVTGKLGEGGMGIVYAAVHPIIGKRVAVKVLAEHVAANREVVRRFVAEARAVNQIGHRNIVDVFGFGQLEDGREFYVMEHLSGRSLEDEIQKRGGKMEAGEIVDLMRPTLGALQAAHDAGIVHRDLKPDNVFLVGDPKGNRDIKVLDFGIAKLSGEESALTRTKTGVAMGTPDYMSPEQCRGANVDHRTDIYAIGVILYQMFTGKLPFAGTATMEIFFKQMHDPPPPPSSVAPLPAAFERIIMRCLEKEPDARFASMKELSAALEEALGAPGDMVTTERPAAAPAAPAGDALDAARTEQVAASAAPVEAVPKRRGALVAVALVALAAAGGGAFALLRGGDDAAPTRPPIAVPAAATDAAPRVEPPVVPPDAAPAKPGKLVVKSNRRDAEVFLDGKPIGRGAVVEVAEVAAGPYVVEVRAKRYQAQSKPVEVAAGGITSEAFVLERERRGSGDAKPPTDGTDGTDDAKPPLDDKDGTIDVFGNKQPRPQPR